MLIIVSHFQQWLQEASSRIWAAHGAKLHYILNEFSEKHIPPFLAPQMRELCYGAYKILDSCKFTVSLRLLPITLMNTVLVSICI